MSDSQRWQVPVLEDDAKEISRLARGLGMTQAVMTVHLLEAALEARENVNDWIAGWLGLTVSRARDVIKRKRRRPPESQATVRIEVQVPNDIAKEIERIAAGLGNTPVRMASLLLRAGIDENSGIIDIVSKIFKRRIVEKSGSAVKQKNDQGGSNEAMRKRGFSSG